MITELMARDMMERLAKLRRKADKTKSLTDKAAYHEYESECLETLRYFVEMKAGKYRKFANHPDLTQEGMEALLKAIRTFKLKDSKGKDKGSFFFWAGLFVNTKLSRSANNHTVIRYPMHVAKLNKPHKENNIPVILDTQNCPETLCEESEVGGAIRSAFNLLTKEQKDVVNLVYGFEGDRPLSITKVCQTKKISRAFCLKTLNGALEILRDKIEI